MIKEIRIEKYKSIEKLNFNLGRINVLIGENGAGKSNILEAIALAGATSANKLDNEFLTSRGIRVTNPEYMRAAFPGFNTNDFITINIQDEKGNGFSLQLTNSNTLYSKWKSENPFESIEKEQIKASKTLNALEDAIKKFTSAIEKKEMINEDDLHKAFKLIPNLPKIRSMTSKHEGIIKIHESVRGFIIYSPENSSLRNFQKEGQIEPLGINGEGLLRLMSVLHSEEKYKDVYLEIKKSLRVLGWYEDMDVVDDDKQRPSWIKIKDKYLEETKKCFDQMSTNEGFLFLVFYFALFSFDLTPKFFAVDNIDASLNPKLCSNLMRQLVALAKKHDKQVILTTHNPAILDGLNLDDDEQRLFVVSRNRNGYTKLKRIAKPASGEQVTKLSELFMRGAIGGLPKSF